MYPIRLRSVYKIAMCISYDTKTVSISQVLNVCQRCISLCHPESKQDWFKER
jgi:hypothetical protein